MKLFKLDEKERDRYFAESKRLIDNIILDMDIKAYDFDTLIETVSFTLLGSLAMKDEKNAREIVFLSMLHADGSMDMMAKELLDEMDNPNS